ncbi:MAG TPA: aldo/keto reductase [Myxococcaceae bacterium]|nr:aldo/keto reductase [Myxococcaceae bacterium]
MRNALKTRTLGKSGPAVSALGLGAMGMSDFYGPADRAESVATLKAALDAGITLIDTGDFYGSGHNELLVGEALRGRRRDEVVVSVKFGALRDPRGGFIGYDLRPAAIKNFLSYSLKRLDTDRIDIYRPARIPSGTDVEEVMGTLAELVKAGHIRHIGLSEVGAGTLRRAAAIHPVVDLQIEYSLVSRGIESDILPTARELGIGITAYGVLSRGLLSGHWRPERTLSRGDFRSFSPRFRAGNVERNLELVEALREVARRKGISVAQAAIAWVLSRGEDIVPLVGARTRERLGEALGAAEVTLTARELEEIARAVPPDAVAGERYPEPAMADLDSERARR